MSAFGCGFNGSSQHFNNCVKDGAIKSLLEEPGTKLVYLGVGHLAGPDSVVKMLKNDGVKVKAVK